jgi:hypothetical protein
MAPIQRVGRIADDNVDASKLAMTVVRESPPFLFVTITIDMFQD